MNAELCELTPEDLLAMPNGNDYELVRGCLVERHMGIHAGVVVARLIAFLQIHCDQHSLGYVIPGSDGGYQGFPDSPRTVRKPDISFVRFGRFPNEELPQGYGKLAPDLAVEVISPGDLYEEVDEKIEEYLRAGVRLVWIISPKNRTVRGYRPNGSCFSLRTNDELDGEDVLPGFRRPVRNLFPQPPASANQEGQANGPTS